MSRAWSHEEMHGQSDRAWLADVEADPFSTAMDRAVAEVGGPGRVHYRAAMNGRPNSDKVREAADLDNFIWDWFGTLKYCFTSEKLALWRKDFQARGYGQ